MFQQGIVNTHYTPTLHMSHARLFALYKYALYSVQMLTTRLLIDSLKWFRTIGMHYHTEGNREQYLEWVRLIHGHAILFTIALPRRSPTYRRRTLNQKREHRSWIPEFDFTSFLNRKNFYKSHKKKFVLHRVFKGF